MVGKARLGRPMYLEDKMQAEQSDETELKWLVQPQLRPKGITSVSGRRRLKPGCGQRRRKFVVTHFHQKEQTVFTLVVDTKTGVTQRRQHGP